MERTIKGKIYDFTRYEVEANGQIQLRYPHYAGIVSPGCECFTCESLRDLMDGQTICEHCASDGAELRECGHEVCERCYSGECPICAGDARCRR